MTLADTHVHPPENPESTDPRLPLHGLVVLDLTTFLSGPYCTQILADLGAEVIKLEPLTGDSSRGIPPHFIGDDSAYYLGNNRNKTSVALNLKSSEGLEIALGLAARADVVVENFRPGVASKLGLDCDALRAERPGLIWASISGFGQSGPWRDRLAYDMIVQALSGVMSLTGHPEQPSARLGIPAGDLAAGMFAAIGVLAAVASRAVTGVGRTIDVSMLDGQLSMLSYQAVYALLTGTAPGPQSSRHDSIPTYRSFTGGDGRELVVTANTERMWAGLCDVLGVPELVADERFRDARSRLTHRDELWPLLEQAFLARDAAEWVDLLTAGQVPAALIKTVPEALADAGDAGRGMLVDLADEAGHRVRTMATPITFVGDRPRRHTYPPRLGQDTEEVLGRFLGISGSRVAELREAGILIAEPLAHDARGRTAGE
ncbi:CoA transferase [Streptomyces sp. NPDC047000]|uniref:CaiB/BaiF CoA transferase family protein n=1 Tax=Streptomyces sp. NPDC047000 TaxID=3155474 RepID=UPI003400E553